MLGREPRAYIPEQPVAVRVRERLVAEHRTSMKMGDVRDFSNFLGAVIDKNALRFKKHKERHRRAPRPSSAPTKAEVILGGECDDSDGILRPARR